MAFRDPNDLGIVLYQRNVPGGATYVDIEGQTRSIELLDSTYRAMSAAISTAHPSVSAAAAASMFVVVGGLDMGETITVRCRQAYYNADPKFAGPPLVFFDALWARQDTVTDQVAIEFELTNGVYLLQTSSVFNGDELEFSAKTNGDAAAAFVVIGCKVGP